MHSLTSFSETESVKQGNINSKMQKLQGDSKLRQLEELCGRGYNKRQNVVTQLHASRFSKCHNNAGFSPIKFLLVVEVVRAYIHVVDVY